MTEEVEHHRARPDHRDRVRDVAAIDVRRRAVHRLEQRRELALGVQVGRRCQADRAGTRWPQVGEDVAEQVRRDDDIEALRR
jgi:hypothetical protein